MVRSPATTPDAGRTSRWSAYCGRSGSGSARTGTVGQPGSPAAVVVVAPVVGGAFAVVGVTRVVVVVRARRDVGDEHAARTASSTTTARARTPYGRVVARTVLIPTCVWRATTGLVIALDGRFGEPVDAYVNGSQVWLRDDGQGDITVEWRLHPVAGYRRPAGLDTYDVLS